MTSPLCIAGAHRSGTSMLTRLLHRCGLELGPQTDLMPAGSDNPDGFWENLRFVSLNDQLLNAAEAAWDLPSSEDENFAGPQFGPIRTKAKLLIESFSWEARWGWKDPRNCLTLPFWQGLLPNLRTVIIVRNPLEVAYSMHRRNGTSYALGLRLWEIYNRRLLANAPAEKRLITDYQAFFERPTEELRRIVAFIGLASDSIEAAAAIVTRDHRHTSFSIEQLIDAGASDQIIALYGSLLEVAKHGEAFFRDDTPASASPPTKDLLAGAANTLNLAIPEAETTRRELAERRGTAIARDELINQLKARLEEMSANAQRAALEIGRRDGRITELQAAYTHLDKLLLREQAGRDKLLANLDAKHKELDRARERFAQTNRLLHSYSIRMEEREQESVSLTERLRKQMQKTKRLVKLLDEVENAAERLRVSRRWIIGNFFSWLLVRFSGRRLPGFGHLDKTVEKYRAWKRVNPEVYELNDAISVLRFRQSPPLPSLPQTPDSRRADPPLQAVPAAPAKTIQFPIHTDIVVSIIIPVFNQLAFTQACLESIQEHAPDISYEVIVVDDCSVDATRKALGSLAGVTYLRNDSNRGFIASCNRGARAARGVYLLFLNNDTVVTTGWLEHLLQTFEFQPLAGLVGSKLVYPDGRLQEAGGIIWRDGTGWNRGKFQDANEPQYNYLREVDYCSAASVLIPSALFHELGGFDQKYAPAYYEDTDLAFKVAQSGRKVLYQPQSVVIHYEGITGGTNPSTGTKKHQEINRAAFRDAWATELERKPENGDILRWEALEKDQRRILVIDHHLPFFDRDSGSLRMFQILTVLSQLGHRISFIADNLADIPPYGDELRARGIEVLHHPYVRTVADYLKEHGKQFDVVILSRCDFAQKHIANVRHYIPQARVIFDTVDLHFLREQREADLTQDFALKKKASDKFRLESELIDEADETWVVSPAECELLHAKWPDKSIQIVSNIVEAPGSVTPFALRHDFLFIGSFQHTPNIDAVLFFVREILPLVRRKLAGARFYVIGDKAPPDIFALAEEDIVITGYQAEVAPFFNSVKLSVAPLRFGAGVKGKINQSMGFGVPVVATSIAVEGMDLTHREDVLIGNNPDEFAAAFLELYQSEELWNRVSRNGITKTVATFSREAAQRQLSHLLSDDHLHSIVAPGQRQPFFAYTVPVASQ